MGWGIQGNNVPAPEHLVGRTGNVELYRTEIHRCHKLCSVCVCLQALFLYIRSSENKYILCSTVQMWGGRYRIE